MIEALLMGGAMGAQIKTIQHIVDPLVNSSEIDITLDSSVDPEKTIVFWSQGADGTASILCTCELLDPDTVRIKKVAGVNHPCSIFVVEFKSGVFVQRGTQTVSNDVTVPISPINAEKSIAVCSFRANGSTDYDTAFARVAIQDSQNLSFRRGESISSSIVHWQVAEFS